MSLANLLSEDDSAPHDWRDSAGSDLTITLPPSGRLPEQVFKLHRARVVEGPRYCGYFQTVLKSKKGPERVTLGADIVPPLCRPVMEQLWHFIYAGGLDPPPKEKDLVPLLKLGFTLDIKDLRHQAYQGLRSQLEAPDEPTQTALLFLAQSLVLAPGLENVEKAGILCLAERLNELTQAQLNSLPPNHFVAVLECEEATATAKQRSKNVCAYLRWHRMKGRETAGSADGKLVEDSAPPSRPDTAAEGTSRPSGGAGAGGQDSDRKSGESKEEQAAERAELALAAAKAAEKHPYGVVDRDFFMRVTRSLSDVEPDDALFMLEQAVSYEAPPFIMSLCMSAVARNFDRTTLDDLDGFGLQTVRALLSRDDLKVASEDKVFATITAYLTRIGSRTSPDKAKEAETLWTACRFPFLRMTTLLRATASEGIPVRLVMEGVTAAMIHGRGEGGQDRLGKYVAEGSHPAPGGTSRLVPRTSYRRMGIRKASETIAALEAREAEAIERYNARVRSGAGGSDTPPRRIIDEAEKNLCKWIGEADAELSGAAIVTASSLGGDEGIPRRRFLPLYVASRDGWLASDFHRVCDNVGPTLVIVSTVGGHVFGGYAAASWTSEGGYINAKGSFLFTFNCAAGLPPTRMKLKKGLKAQYCAICAEAKVGPTFGDGYDLFIASDAASPEVRSYTHMGSTYEVPPLPKGYTKETFLTGATNFWPAEVEVLRVAPSTTVE